MSARARVRLQGRPYANDDIPIGTRVIDDPDGWGCAGELYCASRTRWIRDRVHLHLQGGTGSGKTTLLIAILRDLLKKYQRRYPKADGTYGTVTLKDAFLVVDFGGDLALFNTLKEACEEIDPETGQPTRRFLWLNSEDPQRSYYFFLLQFLRNCRVGPAAAKLVDGCQLSHGMVYGAFYFKKKAKTGARRFIEPVAREIDSGNWPYLKSIFENTEFGRDEDAIAMTLEGIFEDYPQFSPLPTDTNTINMWDAIPNGQFILAHIPGAEDSTTMPQVGGTLLETAKTVRRHMYQNRKPEDALIPLPHLWIVVDEFHRIVTPAFGEFLSECGKLGIGVLMANQTRCQLETREISIADIVAANADKGYFGVGTQEEVDYFLLRSKEVRRTLRADSERAGGSIEQEGVYSGGTTETQREYITTRWEKNDLLDVTNTKNHFIWDENVGDGHREPIRLFRDYDCPEWLYNRRKATPVPEVAHPMANNSATGAPYWQQVRDRQPMTAAMAEWTDRLISLWESRMSAVRFPDEDQA